jgi:hypothetical protein
MPIRVWADRVAQPPRVEGAVGASQQEGAQEEEVVVAMHIPQAESRCWWQCQRRE